jgi:hypothetical protein
MLSEEGFRITERIGAGRLPYFWKSMILIGQKHEVQEGASK